MTIGGGSDHIEPSFISNINKSATILPENKEIDYTELINEYNLNLHTIKTKKIKVKKCQPIEPDSNFKTFWDITGLFLILYCAVVIPYRVAFNMQSYGMFRVFEYSIDVFFMIDVCKYNNFFFNLISSGEPVYWILQKGNLDNEAKAHNV
jgi:hypothetical protein